MNYDDEIGPEKQRANVGRRYASTILLGFAIVASFVLGMEYGARHPERAPLARWMDPGSERTPLTAKPTSTSITSGRPDDDPGRLITEISTQVTRLDRALERLEQSDQESTNAMALLLQDGMSKESAAYREQFDLREATQRRLERVRKERAEAHQIELNLIEESRKQISRESDAILDPALRDKAKTYLIRRKISEDLD